MLSISKYFERLRHSSFNEVVYRLCRVILAHRMKHKVMQGDSPLSFPPNHNTSFSDLNWPELVYSESLQGQSDGISPRTLNLPLNDIAAFEKATAKLYFSDISIPPDGPDIRQVWEPARLQHVVQMILQARASTSFTICEERFSKARLALLDWIIANPFLKGIHYLSPMECGLRIPVFLMALKCIDTLNDQERQDIYKAAYSHAWWVYRNLSLYNSLGNHTICEAVGLVFAGACFKASREGSQWLEKGIQLLEDELTHQINPDGGPAEQSLAYFRFVIDLYAFATDFLQQNNLHDCRRIGDRLEKAEAFLSVFDRGGGLPTIGDSDDGHALAFGVTPKRPSVPSAENGIFVFEETGYTVFRGQNGALLTFDHGPLGMPPLYNHGHADALAITLSIDGTPFLIDPGTYRYNGAADYRRYFKGTAAHNTVSIDQQDQAWQQSSFIWRHPFKTQTLQLEERGHKNLYIEAQHDGYKRLPSPVLHRRQLTVTEGSQIMIRDFFEGTGEHTFTLHYHIHPDVHVKQTGKGWRLTSSSHIITIFLDDVAGFQLIRGQEKPLMGWFSPAYGIIQPCSVLRRQKIGLATSMRFETRIEISKT